MSKLGYLGYLFFFLLNSLHAAPKLFFSKTESKYVIVNNNCPKTHIGKLALSVIKDYESGMNLLEIKDKILSEGLSEKYFLNDYHIDMNPISRKFTFKFSCPKPLLKAQIYDRKRKKSYSGILGDNGEMMDPAFEVVLRQEGMLKGKLPFMAIDWDDLVNKKQYKVVKLLDMLSPSVKDKLSEVILNSDEELTLILRAKSKGISVFLGDDSWDVKLDKLTRVLGHFEKMDRMPNLVNLASTKKVVVKFADGR